MRQRGMAAWAKWRSLVAEQDQSGRSVAAFCRERGLRDSQLFAWKRRLRNDGAAQFVEVRPAVEPVRSTACDHAIEVRLAGGRSLVVEPGFDASHLLALLLVLEPGA